MRFCGDDFSKNFFVLVWGDFFSSGARQTRLSGKSKSKKNGGNAERDLGFQKGAGHVLLKLKFTFCISNCFSVCCVFILVKIINCCIFLSSPFVFGIGGLACRVVKFRILCHLGAI